MASYETFVIYAAIQDEMWDQVSLKLLGSERYTNVLIGANPLYNRVVRFDGGEILLIPSVATSTAVGTLPWSTNYSLT
jgi:hypothetical protein